MAMGSGAVGGETDFKIVVFISCPTVSMYAVFFLECAKVNPLPLSRSPEDILLASGHHYMQKGKTRKNEDFESRPCKSVIARAKDDKGIHKQVHLNSLIIEQLSNMS